MLEDLDDFESPGPHQLNRDGNECVRCGTTISTIIQLAEECPAP